MKNAAVLEKLEETIDDDTATVVDLSVYVLTGKGREYARKMEEIERS